MFWRKCYYMEKESYVPICKVSECTACNGCLNICKHDAISYKTIVGGSTQAVINKDLCVNCNMCKLACPQVNDVKGSMPHICYASWSNDPKIRVTSASGGVAAELYKLFLERNGVIAGVYLNTQYSATYKLSSNYSDIYKFQNSKYVYSDTKLIYYDIEKNLKEGEKDIFFIGLPCQVAGLKQYLAVRKVFTNRLYTADLVCHGVIPTKFLQEHISYIEKKKREKADGVSFRNPQERTSTYTFTLSNKGRIFYKKRVKCNDSYQIAYHMGIAYRQNCYTCKYSMVERQGDITLADFAYVGKLAPCSYSNENVSCILVNTKKGKEIIEQLSKSGKVFLEERPIKEEIDNEMQLHRPTPTSSLRKKFIMQYTKYLTFEKAIRNVIRKQVIIYELMNILHMREMKRLVRKLLIRGD